MYFADRGRSRSSTPTKNLLSLSKRAWKSGLFALLSLAFGLAVAAPPPANEMIAVEVEPIQPLPLSIELNSEIVRLGEKLFHDPRLSHDNAISCVSCHNLAAGGDDNLPLSITNTGKPDVIHAPTVFNSGFNFRQTWRGAFRTLEQQAEDALHNPRHINMTWKGLLPKLQAIPDYAAAFQRLYPGGLNRDTVLNAIATYERSLITPNSRFDKYLRGDTAALNAEEQRGYQLFREYGCISCHHGINIGGTLFQKLGIFSDYFGGREITQADLGRFNVTGKEEDKYVFKVPSLRNVAVTAPYFHDGRVATLEGAVAFMGRGQLGRTLANADIQALVRFLHTLTGEYQGKSLEAAP
jgi:cytochrome c peroxidase